MHSISPGMEKKTAQTSTYGLQNKTILFCLSRAKIINTTLALKTTKYLAVERDFVPWESALRNLDYYIFMFDRTEVYEALQASTGTIPLRRKMLDVTDNPGLYFL